MSRYDVKESSIKCMAKTYDRDEHGFLVTAYDVNRRLMCGLGVSNHLVWWLESNGDPSLLYEDAEHIMDWLEALGDAPQSRQERIKQGRLRLLKAIEAIRKQNIYPDNHADLEWAEWITLPQETEPLTIDKEQQLADRAVSRYAERHPSDTEEDGCSVYDRLWEAWSYQPESDPPLNEAEDLAAFAKWVDNDAPGMQEPNPGS